jgi:hypothetical protein
MAEIWEGYEEWSDDLESHLEESAWHGAKKVSGVLIKKACEHSNCPHYKCERGLRMGGFEL